MAWGFWWAMVWSELVVGAGVGFSVWSFPVTQAQGDPLSYFVLMLLINCCTFLGLGQAVLGRVEEVTCFCCDALVWSVNWLGAQFSFQKEMRDCCELKSSTRWYQKKDDELLVITSCRPQRG